MHACMRVGVGVSVGGFDKAVADGCTVVFSGRPMPASGAVIQHGEGIGFILDPWGDVWSVEECLNAIPSHK